MLLSKALVLILELSEALYESHNGQNKAVKGLFTRTSKRDRDSMKKEE